MLHLRVIAPVGQRDEVLGVLRRHVGVTHIVVHRDAALDPPGDEITADIARESANEVVDDLKALDLRRLGAITLDVVDTVVSNAAYRAEKEADGDPGDAIVWEELVARTREESTFNVTFLTFLCLACMIAAVGVVTNSPVTVVGAMVVGPEFGPLAALAVALVRRRLDLARRASIALLVGFPVAMAVTAAFVLGGEALGWIQLQNTDQLTEVDFIFQVGPLSFVVALLAGAAGMLSLVSAKSAALVGVFISVTTVPAAGFAVVAASVGDWDVAVRVRRPVAGQPGRHHAGRGAGPVGAASPRNPASPGGLVSSPCGVDDEHREAERTCVASRDRDDGADRRGRRSGDRDVALSAARSRRRSRFPFADEHDGSGWTVARPRARRRDTVFYFGSAARSCTAAGPAAEFHRAARTRGDLRPHPDLCPHAGSRPDADAQFQCDPHSQRDVRTSPEHEPHLASQRWAALRNGPAVTPTVHRITG